jgi:hypothetical protein
MTKAPSDHGLSNGARCRRHAVTGLPAAVISLMRFSRSPVVCLPQAPCLNTVQLSRKELILTPVQYQQVRAVYPMHIVLHAGVHATDEDRLIKCFLKNTQAFAALGIAVPGPSR